MSNVDELLKRISKHREVFGYSYVPAREVIMNQKEYDECMELYSKSIEDNIDYIAIKFNIDVEHIKKRYDEIID